MVVNNLFVLRIASSLCEILFLVAVGKVLNLCALRLIIVSKVVGVRALLFIVVVDFRCLRVKLRSRWLAWGF